MLWGEGWGERKREGMPFPSSHCPPPPVLFIFLIFAIFIEIPSGSFSQGERYQAQLLAVAVRENV